MQRHFGECPRCREHIVLIIIEAHCIEDVLERTFLDWHFGQLVIGVLFVNAHRPVDESGLVSFGNGEPDNAFPKEWYSWKARERVFLDIKFLRFL